MRLRIQHALLCAFLLAAMVVAGQSQQKIAPTIKTGERPFDAKMRVHRSPDETASLRTAFEKELRGLPARLQTARAEIAAGPRMKVAAEQEATLARLSTISDGTLEIHWDETRTVPRFLKGSRLQPVTLAKSIIASDKALAEQSMAFVHENRELLRLEDPENDLRLERVERDAYDRTHVRYQQMHQGLEVWGRDVIVHLNPSGLVDAFNGSYIPSPGFTVPTETAVSKAQATQSETALLPVEPRELETRLLIWVAEDQTPHLAWLVTSRVGYSEHWHHFVDAQTGETLLRYNEVAFDGAVKGQGLDLADQSRQLDLYQLEDRFYLIDTSKPMFDAANSTFPGEAKGAIYTYTADNGDGQNLFYWRSQSPFDWSGAPHAVSAAANSSLVYDYYLQVHNRNSIDGKGTSMHVVVDYQKDLNNAFWNGEFMLFGNGDGVKFGDWAASLDITGHEMTHGVDQYSGNLIYLNQSGALDESFADIFGTLLEFWVRGDDANWLICEEAVTPAIAGDALRDLEDPGSAKVPADQRQPSHMNMYQNVEFDNGGVHINSGIPNKAFYLFANSIGLKDAEKIYYQCFTQYMTRNAQFIDARLGVIRAAEDIFGVGSAQAQAAAKAFDDVGIFGAPPTPPPPVLPPVLGREFLALIDASNGGLLTYDLGANQFAGPLNFAATFSRPTVTENGEFIVYVDTGSNLHVVATDGSGDRQLTFTGGYRSIALSPNGRFLAATANFIENRIHVLDLQSPNGQFFSYNLYNPTTAEGIFGNNVLYPDRLDWASDSELLMYDAYNIRIDSFGDTTGYWDINLLRITDGLILSMFPPQEPGVDLGNPVFASNTDNIIALDFANAAGEVTVLTVNLNTGDQGKATFNFASPGSPSFSRDDTRIYYQFFDQSGTASVWFVDLLADGLNGDGQDQQLITGGYFPVNFAVGERMTTDVSDEPAPLPTEFTLAQNFPNPFNPSTTIAYTLPQPSRVSLRVYDLAGRVVRELETGDRAPGRHSVQWDSRNDAGAEVASGMYLYRLEFTPENGKRRVLTRKLMLVR